MGSTCCAPAAPTCKCGDHSDNSGTVPDYGAPPTRSRLEKKRGCDCNGEQQKEDTGINGGAVV